MLQQEHAGIAEQLTLQSTLLELISLTANKYLLTLDPAMDSNLLAGLLVDQLPRNHSRLEKYFFMAQGASRPASAGELSEFKTQSFRELQHDFSLFQADFNKIIADAQMVLQIDGHYYGISPSLHITFA